MTIYLVPGLANDKRIFKNLSEYLSDYNLVYLEHLPTTDLDETIEQYVNRLIIHYGDFDENSVIIGMSLGGIIATELSKKIKFRRVVLISTVKHKSELPLLIRAAKKFNIHIPPILIKSSIKPISIFLGVTNSDGADYIHKMINDANEEHIIWAQRAAAKWENRLIPDNYIHIHGTNDEIFPFKYIKPTHKIEGGTHYMIMDRAGEISEIIKNNI